MSFVVVKNNIVLPKSDDDYDRTRGIYCTVMRRTFFISDAMSRGMYTKKEFVPTKIIKAC